MGKLVVDDRDLVLLPNALLALTKSHLRVSTSEDDDYIKMVLASAIAWFEGETDVTVSPITVIWTPDAINFCEGRARIPVSPVSLEDWTVSDGVGDSSANYAVTTMSVKGTGTYALEGGFVGGMSMTFDAGYWSVDDLPPGIRSAILLYTGHLYENREFMVPGGLAVVPGWMTNVIAPWWRPRV